MVKYNSYAYLCPTRKMERQLVPSVGYDVLLPELLKQEPYEWQSSTQMRRIKQPKFPYITAVDGFDCGRCSPLAGMFLQQLADYNFVQNKSNLILVENSVEGKPHLSITLGMDAYGAGIPWGLYSVTRLAHKLAETAYGQRLNKLLNAFSKVDLLIVNEPSYLTFHRAKSELLFQMISEWSERVSVIVSTNLEYPRRTELFENAIMVKAEILKNFSEDP